MNPPDDRAATHALWPLLTPADSAEPPGSGYEVTSRIPQASLRIRTSSVRPRPPKSTSLALGGFGFRCGLATHPANTASNWVRVPWPVHLPPASSGFRPAADTLALGYGRRSPAPVRDFHPRDDAHAGRTTKSPSAMRPSGDLSVVRLLHLYNFYDPDDSCPILAVSAFKCSIDCRVKSSKIVRSSACIVAAA